MKHFGDITELDGRDLPVVDVITGGSPCQNLSIAGNKEGLKGEQSRLFLEQIRIVKEMREHDKRDGRAGIFIRPRFCIWENVQGALSSNNGRDFQTVLTEFAKVADEGCPCVPMPESGKWSKFGCIYDEMGRWSIAWRLHDAQWWGTTLSVDGRVFEFGTPQRRKRIALVADFGGLAAPEILFIRKGLYGDFDQSEEAGEAAAAKVRGCFDEAGESYTLKVRGGVDKDRYGKTAGKGALIQDNLSATLGASQDQTLIQYKGTGIHGDVSGTLDSSYYKGCGERAGIEREVVFCLEGNGARQSHHGSGYSDSETMYTLNTIEQHAVAIAKVETNSEIYDARGHGGKGVCLTITGDHEDRITDYTAVVVHEGNESVSYGLCRASYNQGKNAQFNFSIDEEKIATQTAKGPGAVVTAASVARRLTPLECERLQGFPDNWTDIGDWTDDKGKMHRYADSPRYKAVGNSICLPFWEYLARRICAQYERRITMGSLFDGIGGFPLVFQRCGAIPVWASEIEPFAIAVTKKHFPEDEDKT